MKLFLHATKDQQKEHTQKMITHIITKHKKHEIVHDAASAELIMVSVCDITEASEIIKARRYGKPVIGGGMLSETPIINELSDYVWHGEIYDFAQNTNPLNLPFVTTKDNKKLAISERIEWAHNPIVCVGNRSAYYYTSKGCPARCKYCLIGNSRNYQQCPEDTFRAAEKAIKTSKKSMIPVAAYNPYATETTRAITEIMLAKYISPQFKKNEVMIRTGIEFVRPDYSANLAKGVTGEMFHEAICKSAALAQKMILYFIAGIETQEEVEAYFEKYLPRDFKSTPAITVNFTYLDPQQMTPLARWDISQKQSIDTKRVFYLCNGINKRIRINPISPLGRSTARTMMQRTTSEKDFGILRRSMNSATADTHERLVEMFPALVGSETIAEIIDRKRGDKLFFGDYWKQ